MAEPKQKSYDQIPYLTRYVPAWTGPAWLAAERWRRVVENQPIAAICEGTIVADIQGTQWEVRAKDPKQEDRLAPEIEHYTNIVLSPELPGAISGFDNWVALVLEDTLRLPVGGNSEIVRYPDGYGPLSSDHPKGHVAWLSYIDGATLAPTYDPQLPMVQRLKGDIAQGGVYFKRNEIMRLISRPRTDMERWGYSMAPPEKIYLAILSLYRGDAYYANLLLDTPEAGLLDLGEIELEEANQWLQSFRELMTGIDPFKIPVIYQSKGRGPKYIPFGRPPNDIMFDGMSLRYSQITHAGYGLTLTDTGLGDPAKTLAGSIRDERRSRRSGFGTVREKVKNAINGEVLPPELEFFWIERDEEAMVQKGRSFVLFAQALKAIKESGFISAAEGQKQLQNEGYFDIDLEPPKEPTQPPAPAPVTTPESQQVVDKVPASEGGNGDLTGKAAVEEHQYASTQIDMPDHVIRLLADLASRIDPDDLAGNGTEAFPHITVKFGLVSDDPTPVIAVARLFEPFHIITGQTSLFQNDDFDVLKAEIKGDELRRLNRLISRIGAADTHPGYNPHLTIAYLKPGQGSKYLHLGLPELSIPVSVLTLSRKDRSLVKIPLGDDRQFKADLETDSDYGQQMARLFRRGFTGMNGRMDRPRLLRLVKAATRSLYPVVSKAVYALDDPELPGWLDERLKLWFGQSSEFDQFPDVAKANRDILDALDKILDADTWWQFDQAEFTPELVVLLKAAFGEGAIEAAQQVQEFLYTEGLRDTPSIVGLSFDLKNPTTLKELQQSAAELVRRVNDGTKYYLKRVITAGVDEGLSSPEIAALIREGADADTVLRQAGFTEAVVKRATEEIRGLSDYRANSIVNTEINRAESMGRLGQWVQMGLSRKGWRHTGPADICHICAANVEMGLIPIGQPFQSVFGETQTPPAHPSVCHCDLTFDEDELLGKAGNLNVWTGD